MKRPIFAGGSLYKSADKFIRVSSDPWSGHAVTIITMSNSLLKDNTTFHK